MSQALNNRGGNSQRAIYMAVAAPPRAQPQLKRSAGLLLAGWVLGLIGFIISLAYIFFALAVVGTIVGTVPGGTEFFLQVFGIWLWLVLVGPVLGLVGTILVFMAWSRAKRGEEPGALGIVGGVLLLIGAPGIIGLVGGILAIIGAVLAMS